MLRLGLRGLIGHSTRSVAPATACKMGMAFSTLQEPASTGLVRASLSNWISMTRPYGIWAGGDY